MPSKQSELSRVYRDHMNDIYRYCLFRTNSREDAEDVTAEVFIRFLKTPKNVEAEFALPWLYATASNLCVDYHRRRLKAESIKPAMRAVFADTDDSPWTDDGVWSALRELRPKEQQIIFLRVVEDQSFKAIAKLLNRREGAVKMLYYRAIENLNLGYKEAEDA